MNQNVIDNYFYGVNNSHILKIANVQNLKTTLKRLITIH